MTRCNICHRRRVTLTITHRSGQWTAVERVCRVCQRHFAKVVKK